MRCILCAICWESTYDSIIDNVINVFRVLFSSRIR
nr:MAG TPA: Cerato-platanin-like protein [Caudoviricetes sp.]